MQLSPSSSTIEDRGFRKFLSGLGRFWKFQWVLGASGSCITLAEGGRSRGRLERTRSWAPGLAHPPRVKLLSDLGICWAPGSSRAAPRERPRTPADQGPGPLQSSRFMSSACPLVFRGQVALGTGSCPLGCPAQSVPTVLVRRLRTPEAVRTPSEGRADDSATSTSARPIWYRVLVAAMCVTKQ